MRPRGMRCQVRSRHFLQDRERPGRPEELVRLQEGAAALVADLSEVAAALGGVAGEAMLDATAAQVRNVGDRSFATTPMQVPLTACS
jgi:hypothetical protein